jgi:hypothetical protein
MRAAVREFCDVNHNIQKWVELKSYKKSKIYQKFYDFINEECDNNLDGFLFGVLFLSNNRRMKLARDLTRSFLCNGLLFKVMIIFQLSRRNFPIIEKFGNIL